MRQTTIRSKIKPTNFCQMNLKRSKILLDSQITKGKENLIGKQIEKQDPDNDTTLPLIKLSPLE